MLTDLKSLCKVREGAYFTTPAAHDKKSTMTSTAYSTCNRGMNVSCITSWYDPRKINFLYLTFYPSHETQFGNGLSTSVKGWTFMNCVRVCCITEYKNESTRETYRLVNMLFWWLAGRILVLSRHVPIIGTSSYYISIWLKYSWSLEFLI